MTVREIFFQFMLVTLSRWAVHLNNSEADLKAMVQLPNIFYLEGQV